MIITINGHTVRIVKEPSPIEGLAFKPQMIDFNNDEDWSIFTKGYSKEITQDNYDFVDTLCKRYMSHGIIEIGVSNNGTNSFTNSLLINKPDRIPYLGIDIKDKTRLNNKEKQVYTIQADSFDQTTVRNYCKEINLDKISILLIDGWHSVNACINDWRYTDMLVPGGIVIFHDTNTHPGPTIIVEAINRSIYDVVKYFEDKPDFGLSVAYKKI